MQWTKVVREDIRGADGPLVYWSVTGHDLNLHAIFTTRAGGVSSGPWGELNLGSSVGDDPASVIENRRRLLSALPAGAPHAVQTVHQVHGTRWIEVGRPMGEQVLQNWWLGPRADAMIARSPRAFLAISVADCLPIYIVDPGTQAVGLGHAGWRGLTSGLIDRLLSGMAASWGTRPEGCLAFLGPAIERRAFEVDRPVLDALRDWSPWWREVTYPARVGRARVDLVAAARKHLVTRGIPGEQILDPPGGTFYSAQFYSHRRDGGVTGRCCALLWLGRS